VTGRLYAAYAARARKDACLWQVFTERRRLALKRHEPQGINPYELILELAKEGDKRFSNEASYRLVEFLEPFQGMECGYRTMLILPDRIQLAGQDAF
jgi:hypothetical protein